MRLEAPAASTTAAIVMVLPRCGARGAPTAPLAESRESAPLAASRFGAELTHRAQHPLGGGRHVRHACADGVRDRVGDGGPARGNRRLAHAARAVRAVF